MNNNYKWMPGPLNIMRLGTNKINDTNRWSSFSRGSTQPMGLLFLARNQQRVQNESFGVEVSPRGLGEWNNRRQIQLQLGRNVEQSNFQVSYTNIRACFNHHDQIKMSCNNVLCVLSSKTSHIEKRIKSCHVMLGPWLN